MLRIPMKGNKVNTQPSRKMMVINEIVQEVEVAKEVNKMGEEEAVVVVEEVQEVVKVTPMVEVIDLRLLHQTKVEEAMVEVIVAIEVVETTMMEHAPIAKVVMVIRMTISQGCLTKEPTLVVRLRNQTLIRIIGQRLPLLEAEIVVD